MISVFIVTKNEEKNIDRCLKSLDFADEIIIVDQQSEDNTLNFAKKYKNVKIYHDKYWGYCEPSRKKGAELCTKEWLFNIDGDEEVSDELKKEITKAAKNKNYDAYLVPRKFFYLNKHLKHTTSDEMLLRFHKKGAIMYNSKIHEGLVKKKNIRIGKLNGAINHYPYPNIKAHIFKINKYSSVLAKTSKKYNSFPRKYFGIIYTPIYYFLYYYLIKLGFLDGLNGLIYAIMSAYHEILIYKKIWFGVPKKY